MEEIRKRITEETKKYGENGTLTLLAKHFLKMFEQQGKVDTDNINRLFNTAYSRAFQGLYDLQDLIDDTFSVKYLRRIEKQLIKQIEHEKKHIATAVYNKNNMTCRNLAYCQNKIERLTMLFGEQI